MSSRVRSNSRLSATHELMASATFAAPSAPSLRVFANGETRARWQTSFARRRPMPATMRWSRRNPCTRIELAAKSAASSSALMSAASGPSLSSGGDVSAVSVGTHHTPARRSLPCSVSSSAVSSIDPSSSSIGSNVKRAWPPRGFADRLTSGTRRPPCMRCTTNVTGSNRNSRYLPRRSTSSSRSPKAAAGAGTAVLRAVKLNGVKPDRTRPANWSVRRSACAWISGISGTALRSLVGGAFAHGGEHGVERTEHRL